MSGHSSADIIFDGGHDFDYTLGPFYIGPQPPIAAVDASWTEPSSGATFKVTAIGQIATPDGGTVVDA